MPRKTSAAYLIYSYKFYSHSDLSLSACHTHILHDPEAHHPIAELYQHTNKGCRHARNQSCAEHGQKSEFRKK